MSSLEKDIYKTVKVKSSTKVDNPTTRAYKGFSTQSTNKNEFSLYDFELIKQDIINHFHIRQGEKLSDPTFGCIIWDLLYEPFTSQIQTAIIRNVTEIVNFDPRISVDEIIVDTYEQGIQVEALLTYLPYNISEAMRFKFDQNAGLA